MFFISYALVSSEMAEGVWQWELRLEKEDAGDVTTCLGVAAWPVTTANFSKSRQMWLVRSLRFFKRYVHVYALLSVLMCAPEPHHDACIHTHVCMLMRPARGDR